MVITRSQELRRPGENPAREREAQLSQSATAASGLIVRDSLPGTTGAPRAICRAASQSSLFSPWLRWPPFSRRSSSGAVSRLIPEESDSPPRPADQVVVRPSSRSVFSVGTAFGPNSADGAPRCVFSAQHLASHQNRGTSAGVFRAWQSLTGSGARAIGKTSPNLSGVAEVGDTLAPAADASNSPLVGGESEESPTFPDFTGAFGDWCGSPDAPDKAHKRTGGRNLEASRGGEEGPVRRSVKDVDERGVSTGLDELLPVRAPPHSEPVERKQRCSLGCGALGSGALSRPGSRPENAGLPGYSPILRPQACLCDCKQTHFVECGTDRATLSGSGVCGANPQDDLRRRSSTPDRSRPGLQLSTRGDRVFVSPSFVQSGSGDKWSPRGLVPSLRKSRSSDDLRRGGVTAHERAREPQDASDPGDDMPVCGAGNRPNVWRRSRSFSLADERAVATPRDSDGAVRPESPSHTVTKAANPGGAFAVRSASWASPDARRVSVVQNACSLSRQRCVGMRSGRVGRWMKGRSHENGALFEQEENPSLAEETPTECVQRPPNFCAQRGDGGCESHAVPTEGPCSLCVGASGQEGGDTDREMVRKSSSGSTMCSTSESDGGSCDRRLTKRPSGTKTVSVSRPVASMTAGAPADIPPCNSQLEDVVGSESPGTHDAGGEHAALAFADGRGPDSAIGTAADSFDTDRLHEDSGFHLQRLQLFPCGSSGTDLLEMGSTGSLFPGEGDLMNRALSLDPWDTHEVDLYIAPTLHVLRHARDQMDGDDCSTGVAAAYPSSVTGRCRDTEKGGGEPSGHERPKAAPWTARSDSDGETGSVDPESSDQGSEANGKAERQDFQQNRAAGTTTAATSLPSNSARSGGCASVTSRGVSGISTNSDASSAAAPSQAELGESNRGDGELIYSSYRSPSRGIGRVGASKKCLDSDLLVVKRKHFSLLVEDEEGLLHLDDMPSFEGCLFVMNLASSRRSSYSRLLRSLPFRRLLFFVLAQGHLFWFRSSRDFVLRGFSAAVGSVSLIINQCHVDVAESSATLQGGRFRLEFKNWRRSLELQAGSCSSGKGKRRSRLEAGSCRGAWVQQLLATIQKAEQIRDRFRTVDWEQTQLHAWKIAERFGVI
ncbi:conserved hypothetical protein [Neospora caninum Liverpool]|uniref:PH domain-containing protein n=1 Tax=Neospora caninum (strain Liverpool) TaxID=572307 RepID=F0VIB5_NEOCL|nr:conserved hypothetical protein [Neospora caninum Liverpool]CBZ53476.1 conserved hypothetical protein [Neospora caninum Liverpool]CEL67463.1 TPA: hypothetical protein BN1204_032630 [Neospora caninum Liverpool]|eukprot:XP_003883508.1 conserved hypothetical protein [Neospora caninum Liverpool]